MNYLVKIYKNKKISRRQDIVAGVCGGERVRCNIGSHTSDHRIGSFHHRIASESHRIIVSSNAKSRVGVRFGVVLGSLWVRFRIVLDSFWVRCGFVLRLCWGRVGVVLGSLS